MINTKYGVILTMFVSMVLLILISLCLNRVYQDIYGIQYRNMFSDIDMEKSRPEEIEKEIIMETIHHYNLRLPFNQKLKIVEAIYKESKLTGLEPFFITSVIAAESSFRPDVVSPCAARGLMQVTSVVSQMMHVSNPFDIEQNIFAGTRYLKMLYQQFKDEQMTLAAYNAGPTRVARLKRIPKIRETINYIKRVRKNKMVLKEKFIAQVAKMIKKGKMILNLNLELAAQIKTKTFYESFEKITRINQKVIKDHHQYNLWDSRLEKSRRFFNEKMIIEYPCELRRSLVVFKT